MVLSRELSASLDTVDIDSIALLEGIPRAKRAAVLRCLSATVTYFEKGALLAETRHKSLCTRFLLDGSARIERTDFSGNRSILGKIDKGGLVSSDLTPLFFSAGEISVVTNEPCSTLDFSISGEIEGCECCVKYVNRIKSNLMQSLTQTNTQFMRRLNMLSCRTTRERVLAYLEGESQESGSKTFTIPLSRQELADYLCVERSALSRELGHMRDDGIIDFDRNTFKLLA